MASSKVLTRAAPAEHLPPQVRLHRGRAGWMMGALLVLAATGLYGLLVQPAWWVAFKAPLIALEFFVAGLAIAPALRIWRVLPAASSTTPASTTSSSTPSAS